MADDLFDGVEVFFRAIKEKCSTDKQYAAELLKARGFLLEDNELILSDNSHQDDASYLKELLTESKLGKSRGGKIFIAPGANVEEIFYKDNCIGGEAFCYPESWKMFIHNSYAPKVPVRRLEPFVARYIKAISACGVSTWCSCDGNHPAQRNPQRISIEISDCPNSVWHEIICKNLLVKKFRLNWNCDHDCLKIPFTKADKWTTYAELNRAGEFLYNNRLKIRQIRREVSDCIGNRMTGKLSSDELAKIFSERADRLFKEFFKGI